MSIRVASAPVSWGIYEFRDIAPRYPFARVLDEIAETGHAGLELGPWGYLPTDPEALRGELEGRGLRLLSAFVPVRLADAAAHGEGEAHALRVGRLLAALGAGQVVLSDDNGAVEDLTDRAGRRSGSYLSPDGWEVFAGGVSRIARRVRDDLGLEVVFHHHCAGCVETPEEVRNLMGRTDPDLVGLCLDTGHWHYAGGDALDCVREYGARVRHLHLKDCDPGIRRTCAERGLGYFEATRAGVFCELGRGEVDFRAVLAEMQGLGYEGWAVIEQDVLVDDLEAPGRSARRNRAYLRSLGL